MSGVDAPLAPDFMRDVGPIDRRAAQTDLEMNLPAGTRLVSADNHWEITEDIFHENFPARLRDKAPRVWFDRFWRIGYRGEVEALPMGEKTAIAIERTTGRGGDWSAGLRYRDMEAEGVE